MINQSTESIDMCETVNEISCPDVCWLSSACCNQSQINSKELPAAFCDDIKCASKGVATN